MPIRTPPECSRTGARVLPPLLALLLACLLGACASGPRGPVAPTPSAPHGGTNPATPAPGAERDGPGANPPEDIARIPDAEPRLEPIRSGGPNKPYEVLGESYTPLLRDTPFTQRGLASWYGRKFHGRRTASGEVYDMYGMTAAHRTLPLPSYVRVRNPANGVEVVLRVNDRGPFHSTRVVDLSYTAAAKLGVLNGVAIVEIERITAEDIRTGAWRQGRDALTRVASRELPVRAIPAATPGVPVPVALPGEAALAPALAFTPSTSTSSVATDAASAASATDIATLPPEPPVVMLVAAPPMPSPATLAAPPASANGFWVQLGAFQKRSGADSFHSRVSSELDWLAPVLAVITDLKLFRLQAGPYGNRDEALEVARRVREALQLVPLVLERR